METMDRRSLVGREHSRDGLMILAASADELLLYQKSTIEQSKPLQGHRITEPAHLDSWSNNKAGAPGVDSDLPYFQIMIGLNV